MACLGAQTKNIVRSKRDLLASHRRFGSFARRGPARIPGRTDWATFAGDETASRAPCVARLDHLDGRHSEGYTPDEMEFCIRPYQNTCSHDWTCSRVASRKESAIRERALFSGDTAQVFAQANRDDISAGEYTTGTEFGGY